MLKKIFLLIAFVISMNASTIESTLKIKMISLFSDEKTHVQTEPMHSITGLKCADNYWAFLRS